MSGLPSNYGLKISFCTWKKDTKLSTCWLISGSKPGFYASNESPGSWDSPHSLNRVIQPLMSEIPSRYGLKNQLLLLKKGQWIEHLLAHFWLKIGLLCLKWKLWQWRIATWCKQSANRVMEPLLRQKPFFNWLKNEQSRLAEATGLSCCWPISDSKPGIYASNESPGKWDSPQGPNRVIGWLADELDTF